MIKTHMLRRRGILTVCLALAGLIGGTGCASDRSVIQQASQFHGQLAPAVIDESDDPVLNDYIAQVGNRILAAGREMQAEGLIPEASAGQDNSWMFTDQVQFHFVNSDTVNAFTTGGEHMYIYSELFEKAQTEDELAAVMAHEFAHVYGRHVHKGMNRQLMVMGAAAAGGAAGYALADDEDRGTYAALGAGGALMAGQFIGMGFTRADEAEADDYGFEMYVRAGYDPARFGDFFKRMIEMGYDKSPAILSDHPTLASRVEAAERRAADLPPGASQWRQPPVASPADFRQLQARATRLAGTMPNDQTLAGAQTLLQALPRSCLTPAVHEDQLKAEQRIAQQAEAEPR